MADINLTTITDVILLLEMTAITTEDDSQFLSCCVESVKTRKVRRSDKEENNNSGVAVTMTIPTPPKTPPSKKHGSCCFKTGNENASQHRQRLQRALVFEPCVSDETRRLDFRDEVKKKIDAILSKSSKRSSMTFYITDIVKGENACDNCYAYHRGFCDYMEVVTTAEECSLPPQDSLKEYAEGFLTYLNDLCLNVNVSHLLPSQSIQYQRGTDMAMLLHNSQNMDEIEKGLFYCMGIMQSCMVLERKKIVAD